MAQNLPDYPINGTWISLNTVAGIYIGLPFLVQNKSNCWLALSEGTQPAADNTEGVYVAPVSSSDSTKKIEAGSLEIWCRTIDKTPAEVNIQVL